MRAPQEIIVAKRDGRALSREDIEGFVAGVTEGSITDAQIAAFAMAVCVRGMNEEERVALTLAMRGSGEVLQWPDLPGPIVDKHSTGGIGDKVSLALAPILAACGAFVPMISGRGLGHTGGTLDKLEAIPGYEAAQTLGRFRSCVAEVGCAIVGAGADLAPADKRIYAVRDTTGTVESVALITASILSKKLAAGLDALVMDVKTGSGAFMTRLDDARALAGALESAARGAGVGYDHVISDMSQCLGRTAGNAIEALEAIAWLRGEEVDARLEAVTIELCGRALRAAGIEADLEAARELARRAVASGAAAERFSKMTRALGAKVDPIDRPDALELAPVLTEIAPRRAGVVRAIDGRGLGMALVRLRAGRTRVGQAIDHGVGFARMAAIGEEVGPDRPLATLRHRGDQASHAVIEGIADAFEIADAASAPPLFYPASPQSGGREASGEGKSEGVQPRSR